MFFLNFRKYAMHARRIFIYFYFPKLFKKKGMKLCNARCHWCFSIFKNHFLKKEYVIYVRQKCLIFFIFQILKCIVCNMQCKMTLILLFCIMFLLLLQLRKKMSCTILVFFLKNHFCLFNREYVIHKNEINIFIFLFSKN